MSPITRRLLLRLMARLSAALGAARLVPLPAAADALIAREAASPLEPRLLDALAEAVLPVELGAAGRAAAVRRFHEWVAGYRAGAELNHAYPAAPVTRLPASPAGRWQGQLDALDAQARRQGTGGLASLDIGQRQQLVAQALSGFDGAGLPLPADAPHVALALMAHFFHSPQGWDLCYRAAIGRTRCRPLAEAPRAPRALRPEDLA